MRRGRRTTFNPQRVQAHWLRLTEARETRIGEAGPHRRLMSSGLAKGPTRTRYDAPVGQLALRAAWMPESASRALRLSAPDGFSNEPTCR